jgi:hypothetical protein
MGGWASPELVPWLDKAIEHAGLELFGKKHAFLGEGGSKRFSSFVF